VYRLDWQILPSDVGKAFDISFRVAGLEVGSVRYTPATAGSTAIQFRIDNHPRIRARALVQQGCTATQVARALRDEFYWTAAGTAQFLLDEGMQAVAVGQALRDVFFILDAQRVARILRDAGFSGVDTGEMLKQAFNLDAASACWALRLAGFTSVKDHYLVLTKTYNLSDVFAVEDSLEDLGFAPAEVLELTARPAVERFAPVLGFDRDFRGLPMSAEAYFQNMLTPRIQGTNMYWASEALPPLYVFCRTRVCGREACENGMSNSDFKLLQHGQVPTYYSVVRDDQGKRLRIAYWWFYGWQTSCNDMDCTVDEDGGHHGDWEHVIVTTSEDRSIPEYVTYGFHGNWYTRRWGSFYTRDGVRPVAYVGKYAHGCYHNQDCSGWMAGTPSQCCDYADYRNPNANTWWYSGQNLVSLAAHSESWMLADRIGSKYQYLGQEYTIVSWHWGPPHRWCPLCPCGDNWWQWDWSLTHACSTHPTTDVLRWSMPSCHSWGCGGYRASCPYSCDYDHNQTWPWPN